MKLMTRFTKTGAVLLLLAACSAVVVAQGAAPAKPPEKPIVPVKVALTLSRFLANKTTENLPFTVTLNTNGPRVSLNDAVQVPIPSSTTGTGEGPTSPVATSYTYKSVGTSLTLSAETLDEGRFAINVTINDSSVKSTDTKTPLPVYRSFTIDNRVVLRDGQTVEFVSSTDKVSGEVTKASVTLTVIK